MRGHLAGGKPRKIICTGCGEPAVSAGFVLSQGAERFYGPDATTDDLCLTEDEVHPLCESCVSALEGK